MRRNVSFIDEFAVSEVVGAMILVLIAIVAFAAIYMYVFPLPLPAPEPTVKLKGYVTDDGTAVLEHMGGESLPAYKIDVRALDGTIINTTTYEKRDDPWEIGECNYPPTNTPLLTESDKVNIDVYEIYDDGSFYQVFTGILAGKRKVAQPTVPLMLISSLRTDTIDEDLICYNYTIDPNIDASTYVYNWIVSGNPITKLLMPFDTDSSTIAKDYSGDGHNGTVIGPIWINGGVVGGAYQFDGVNDRISIPYCFDGSTIDKITLETWVKTTANSGVIASFDRNNYWELGFIDGKVRWSTTASDGLTDTIGKTIINNGTWRHIAVTYDAFMGKCMIYVDGKLDTTEDGHGLGELLGLLGDMPQGSIGTSVGVTRKTIFSTGFEIQNEKNNWNENNSGATVIYVDNDASDVDRSADKGSHSNFNNEKAKDSSYDTLTEGNTAGTTTTTLLNDGFEGDLSKWNTNWDLTTSQYTSPTHSVEGSSDDDDLVSNNLNTAGASSISISFKYRVDEIDNDDDVRVQYYDGSNYDDIEEIGDDTEDAWLTYSHTFNNAGGNAQYFISNFRLKIEGSSIDSNEYLWIDDVLIQKEVPSVNYELDLEVQWTNVSYQLPNEELCIYAGTLGNEDIKVQAWDGDSWETVFSDLSSGWNNASVTSWLTSSTFTIRYKDGTPSSDSNMDSWNVDAALLHLWTNQGIFDILPSTTLTPHNGSSYSIGGSGDFYPEYTAFNRTGIDISSYEDVQVSVWYSYKNTMTGDFLGLYYRYNNNWIPIFEVITPQQSGEAPWVHAQVNLPNDLSTLRLQFKWTTSSTSEYVAIDDLEITGIPRGNGANFTGVIDEFHIYNRALSAEQIYQNYLCTKYGYTDKSVIVSGETHLGDIWRCIVTPNDGTNDDTPVESNSLQISSYGGGE